MTKFNELLKHHIDKEGKLRLDPAQTRALIRWLKTCEDTTREGHLMEKITKIMEPLFRGGSTKLT